MATKTRDLVHQAAYDILQGYPETLQLPTVQSVRNKIQQGSSTTINDELKEFWKGLADSVRLPELPEDVALAALTFWEVAAEAGQRAFDTERAEANAEVERAEARAAQSERRAHESLAKLSAAEERAEEAEAALAQAKDEAGKLMGMLTAETSARKQAEGRLAEARERLDVQGREHAGAFTALQTQATQHLNSLKAEHAVALNVERTQHDATEARYAKALDAQKLKVHELEAALAAAKDALASARNDHTGLSTRLETSERERDALRLELKTQSSQLIDASAERAKLEERVVSLERERKRLSDEGARQSQTLKTLEADAAATKTALASTREQLSARDAQLAFFDDGPKAR